MKKKKIKLCLTKQLLNMFKLWCEWGISFLQLQLLHSHSSWSTAQGKSKELQNYTNKHHIKINQMKLAYKIKVIKTLL